MDNLIAGATGGKRALFENWGQGLTAGALPTGQFVLSSPSEKLDAAHWPVRGDLAHVRLAGKVFVPHYAVPMAHELERDAELKLAAKAEAETMEAFTAGTRFDVLDMAGGWAWGQICNDGLVGYFPLDALRAL